MTKSDILRICRGQVWWVTTEIVNQGSKQNKSRPWLIVSNDVCNDKSPVLTAVPLTTADKGDYPFHVAVNNFGATNLILCEQITSIEKSQCEQYMYTVSADVMRKVNDAMSLQIGLIDSVQLTERKASARRSYTNEEKQAMIADYDKHGCKYCQEKYDLTASQVYANVTYWRRKNETATDK